jgi:hypothetical protein
MQYFKGDATELKMYESAAPIMRAISVELSAYFNGVYESVPLGEFIYDENRIPLANAIKRSVFISAFKEIFNAWAFTGTFEAYLTVFRKIFGDDVDVVFTVPGPGRLQIDITSSGVSETLFIAREIVDDEYSFDFVVDDVGDNITFATVQGIETQSELEKMLFTMVPNGIFTEVSLTLGA